MAKADYYLELDGIKGESTSGQHKDMIEVDSFSWGEKQNISTHGHGGLGAGKVQMDHVSFSSHVNKASADVMRACATGEHIKKALLHCCKAGGGTAHAHQQEYLTITLTNVLIAHYNLSGHAGSSVSESFALAFEQIDFSYKPQKADGSLEAAALKMGFNLKTNAVT